ncbi:hypothetical protein Angca_001018, partial [Angiostrongylus cantonensis]
NADGNRLVGFLSAARLFHGNSFFENRGDHRCIWQSRYGTTHAEIDHILTDGKWCLFDTSMVPGFCAGSHHHFSLRTF